MTLSEHSRALLISLIACAVLLVGSAVFGVWAFMGRQDYKFNSDQKADAAVEVAVAQTREEEAEKFAEEEKNPLKPYVGPSQFGAVRLEYPKTWSTYVVNRDGGGTPVQWYLHPNVVPDTANRDNVYALRVEVSNESYDRALARFDGIVNRGDATVRPYALPEVPDNIGSRVDGEVVRGKRGSMVLMPLRNMTLKIWTESPDYLNDFDNIILPNAAFSP